MIDIKKPNITGQNATKPGWAVQMNGDFKTGTSNHSATLPSLAFRGLGRIVTEIGYARPHGVIPGRLSYALDCSALRRDIVRIVRTLHHG